MTTLLTLLLVPGLALLVTAGVTPLVRRAALGLGGVAVTRPDRWHRKPTPTVGGVAIFVGFGSAVLAASALEPDALRAFEAGGPAVAPWNAWTGLILAVSAVFLLGLVDDFVQIRPSTKLAGQVAAAGVLVVSGIGLWLTDVYAVDVLVSLFWFVGLTNAMNLLDNMDGLAAGVGAIAGGVLSALFLLEGQTGLALLSLSFAGALTGFLAHNYPPARIFMGDSGSLFLGLFLAGLALAPAPGLSRGLAAVMAVPVLILSVPILDTTFVTVGRLLEGRPVSAGGRDHTSHGLVELGVSEKRALRLLWSLALAGGLVGLLLRTAERALALLLGGVLLALLALLGVYLLSARHRRQKTEREGVGVGTESAGEDVEGVELLYARILQFHRRLPVLAFALDAALVSLAYYGAYLVRWSPAELGPELAYFRRSLPVLLAVKLGVFALTGMYAPGWRHAGMEDVVRVFRANLLATVGVAAVLLLLDRVGLSRGVLIADFFLASTLILGSRFFFQAMERVTGHWSDEGVAVVVVGPADEAELALAEIRRSRDPHLRVVAVADRGNAASRGRFRGLPLYGGDDALVRAVRDCGCHGVVVVRRKDRPGGLPYTVREYLKADGGLDVYALEVSLERMEIPDGVVRAPPYLSRQTEEG